MSRKTYFRMPDFDHPPNSLVQLGQIITSPREPTQSLAPPLPIPNIQTNKKTNYKEVIARAQKGEIGVWVLFLASIVGAGGDLAAKWAVEKGHAFEFRELDASFFEPSDEYLQKSVVSSERIKDHINKTPHKSLYMVTGVKIARGAKSVIYSRHALGMDVKLGVDGTPFGGVPVEAGPAFKIENAQQERSQFGGSEDFVFAYRLLRIIPKAKGTFKLKRHESGANTLTNDDQYVDDVGKDNAKEPSPNDMDVEITAVSLDSTDYGALPGTLPFEVTPMVVLDKGADTTYIIPSSLED